LAKLPRVACQACDSRFDNRDRTARDWLPALALAEYIAAEVEYIAGEMEYIAGVAEYIAGVAEYIAGVAARSKHNC
jgi:hypothetical protein